MSSHVGFFHMSPTASRRRVGRQEADNDDQEAETSLPAVW